MKKLGKIFILSIFPAPYRTGNFNIIRDRFDTTVFFERNHDNNRETAWFDCNEWFDVLDNADSKDNYKKCLKDFGNYDLFAFYDYSSVRSIQLMLKCILHKKKYVINGDGAILTPNFLKDKVKHFFISRAVACLASGKIAEQYFTYYGAKKENIYNHTFSTLYENDRLNFIPTNEEKSIIRLDKKQKCSKIALAVGRFISLKYFDVLIRAWKSVDKSCKLIIIGGGEERENYECLIRELRLDNIELIDFKPKDELSEYYKMADLFVHPTSSDVWGLVVNEAMARGLPVITTEKCVAGLELIENGENGYTVPVGDETALAEKINLILNNENFRNKMAENNLKKIRNYTIENMARVHMKVFEDIITSNNA